MSNRHRVSAIFILTFVLFSLVSLGQQSQYRAHGEGISDRQYNTLTCRHHSHGVESYRRRFSVTRTSPELDEELSRDKWCNSVTKSLAREFPGGKFAVLSTDERQRIHCPPFNCLGYSYTCTVRVDADPVYKIAASPTCRP